MSQFRHLFSPLRIGSHRVPNRIAMTAMSLSYEEDSLLQERHVNFYAERAKGGIGLIIGEPQIVHPTATYSARLPKGYDKRNIPMYHLLADAVHAHGAKIFMQLKHSGIHSDGATGAFDTWPKVCGPSPIPSTRLRVMPKELEEEEIAEIVEGYGKTARNVQEGGLDGVEVHGAHSFLPAQFMSPLYNKRKDRYGGSLENRLRFTLEVLQKVRQYCGRDFAVGIRISGDELFPGGNTLDDMSEIAVRLEATGLLDYLSISIGCHNVGYFYTPPMTVPTGYAVHLAAGIKRVVKGLPVLAVGRINDPILAEKILADGQADLVGMTRATLCDPEMPRKAMEGRLDDIRHCVACNQGCLAVFIPKRPVTCIQNPAAGRERELGAGTLVAAKTKKKVMVVGGGPAGLEAARIAALRGHEVTLYEKGRELGGQVRLAAKAATRDEFGEITRHLARQVDKLKVEVKLGVEVGAELVKREKPDVVIIATGSVPQKSGFSGRQPNLEGIPGTDQDNVVTVWDVLEEKVKIGDKVVILDEDGGQRAFFTAEYLADKGKQVEIVTPYFFVGYDLPFTNELEPNYPRLLSKGVVFTPSTGVSEIKGDTVVTHNLFTKAERRIEGVGTVVLAMGYSANDDLYKVLKGTGIEMHAIGDCVSPRSVAAAIFEGHKVGRAI